MILCTTGAQFTLGSSLLTSIFGILRKVSVNACMKLAGFGTSNKFKNHCFKVYEYHDCHSEILRFNYYGSYPEISFKLFITEIWYSIHVYVIPNFSHKQFKRYELKITLLGNFDRL